jgi:flagellar motility protein MotE (MotC chaperone)
MRFLFRFVLVQYLVAPLLPAAALAAGNDPGPPLDLQKPAGPILKPIVPRAVDPKLMKGRRPDPMSETSKFEAGKPEPGKIDPGKSNSEESKDAAKPQPRAAQPPETVKAAAPDPARAEGQKSDKSKEEEIKDEAKRPDSKEPKKSDAKKDEPKKDKEPATEDSKSDPHAPDPQAYCTNIATTATDARIAWQANKLSDLDIQIKQRIADLEAKRAEFQDWLARREAALTKAEDGVVAIYSKMRPDAAALQLAAMDDSTAAAVLAKLNPRAASAILNEMSAERAARLTNAMSGPPANPDGKKS